MQVCLAGCFILNGKMKSIEIKGEVPVITFGGFTHAAVKCKRQYNKHIYGFVDPFQT
ncbi:MAG: hypothetical protein GWO38_16255 [Phycisphaerae bacterium]|nr:hypothetical protein [Phycisphaerae bacterium]NIW95421.1 hypothetical protein [Phycisphaerae bacterium]NIX29134.1 hypothetical protein [Phycisphaerae bacterium]